MADNKKCSACGAVLVDGIMFCPNCGTPVEQQEAKTEASTVEETEKTTVEETANAIGEAKDEETKVEDFAKEQIQEAKANEEKVEAIVGEEKEEVAEEVKEEAAQPVQPTQAAQPVQQAAGQGSAATDALMGKIKAFGTAKIAAILGGILAVIIVISIIVSNHKTTINLEDYVKVKVEGYDESGEAEIDWNDDKLDKAILEAMGYDADDEDEVVDAYSDYLEVKGAISFRANKTEGLSNGDKIKVTIKFDNDVAGDHGIKFKGEAYEYTVKGLEELREVDPFEGLTVTFDGKSPGARAHFEYSGEDFIYSYQFSADKEDELKVGDKIKVTCDVSEYTLEDEGVKLSSTEKEYTVEGVDAYFDTLADVESEALTDIKTDTEAVITSYFAEHKDYIAQSGLTYEGCYMLIDKDGDTWYGYNTLYVIYSATVSSKEKGHDKKFKPTKVFFPVKYTEVIKDKDGKITWNRSDYSPIEGSTKLQYSWSNVDGYTDGKDMYAELIEPNKADWNYEISAALQSFGN